LATTPHSNHRFHWQALSWPAQRSLAKLGLGRFFYGQGPEPGPIVLSSRRVYILPTRMGLYYSLLLLILLLSAVNYNNNLTYALTFLLTSIGFLTMLHSYRNLLHLQINIGTPAAVFCGEYAQVPITLENRLQASSDAVSLQIPGQPAVTVQITQQQTLETLVPIRTTRRGRHTLPRINISSVFPLGLFRVWAHAEQLRYLLVYPKPDQHPAQPQPSNYQSSLAGDRGRGADDFSGLRSYHPGDSLRHIHWKAAARSEALYTKEFGGDRCEELWLTWDQLPQLDLEARLSRLTRWVLDASHTQLRYGLHLPGTRIAPTTGPEHQLRCLKALALFKQQPNDPILP